MRQSDFKKGTVIEIPSSDDQFCYAQVIADSDGFAPMLGLLDGVFDHSLSNDELHKRSWVLKKYAHVNDTSSRAYPSVTTWKVFKKENALLNGISAPKAVVHGTRGSGWKVVHPDGRKEFVNGQDCYLSDFEDKGMASKIMWLSIKIEDYMFEDKELNFPDT